MRNRNTSDVGRSYPCRAGLEAYWRRWAEWRHPALVSVRRIGRRRHRLHVEFDWVEGCRSDEWLRSRPSDRDRREALEWAVAGLSFLHHHGLAHGDVRAGNLICRGGRAVWIDPDPGRGDARGDWRALAALVEGTGWIDEPALWTRLAQGAEVARRVMPAEPKAARRGGPKRWAEDILGGPVGDGVVRLLLLQDVRTAQEAWALFRREAGSIRRRGDLWDRRTPAGSTLADARRWLARGDWGAAAEAARAAARQGTASREAWDLVLRAAPAGGRPGWAAEAAAALALRTSDLSYRWLEALWWRAAGRARKAAAAARRAPKDLALIEAAAQAALHVPGRVPRLQIRRSDPPQLRIPLLNAVASLEFARGQYVRARRHYAEVLRAARSCGDDLWLGRALANVALCDIRMGRGGRAAHGLARAAALIRRLRRPGEECRIEQMRAMVEQDRGRWEAARLWIVRATRAAVRSGAPMDAWLTAFNSAQLHMARGEWNSARSGLLDAGSHDGGVPAWARTWSRVARIECALLEAGDPLSASDTRFLEAMVRGASHIEAALDARRVLVMARIAALRTAEAVRERAAGAAIANRWGSHLARRQFGLLRRLIAARRLPQRAPVAVATIVEEERRLRRDPSASLRESLRHYVRARRGARPAVIAAAAEALGDAHQRAGSRGPALRYYREALRYGQA